MRIQCGSSSEKKRVANILQIMPNFGGKTMLGVGSVLPWKTCDLAARMALWHWNSRPPQNRTTSANWEFSNRPPRSSDSRQSGTCQYWNRVHFSFCGDDLQIMHAQYRSEQEPEAWIKIRIRALVPVYKKRNLAHQIRFFNIFTHLYQILTFSVPAINLTCYRRICELQIRMIFVRSW
jgi:hypothetical protein